MLGVWVLVLGYQSIKRKLHSAPLNIYLMVLCLTFILLSINKYSDIISANVTHIDFTPILYIYKCSRVFWYQCCVISTFLWYWQEIVFKPKNKKQMCFAFLKDTHYTQFTICNNILSYNGIWKLLKAFLYLK